MVRYLASKRIPTYFKKVGIHSDRTTRNTDIVVSLTSFPARIEYVWLVVESILRQSLSPQKVLLWLSKQQFPTESSLPSSLKNIKDNRFELRMVDDDIRSHKKYFYAFQEYPESIIVTVDDDTFYNPNMLLALYQDHLLYPESIIANCTKRITYSDGIINQYINWESEEKPYADRNLVQIGFGGVLYPPHSLDEDVLKQDLFMNLCPMADDLWLNGMARKHRTKVIKSSSNVIVLPIMIKNDIELTTTNVNESRNDIQLKALRQYYITKEAIDLFDEKYSFNEQ
ncbi:MAG: glycosyl transferase [Parabacteroides sp.]|nr:glycosyl transferase [Parabacteroides sp.]